MLRQIKLSKGNFLNFPFWKHLQTYMGIIKTHIQYNSRKMMSKEEEGL